MKKRARKTVSDDYGFSVPQDHPWVCFGCKKKITGADLLTREVQDLIEFSRELSQLSELFTSHPAARRKGKKK